MSDVGGYFEPVQAVWQDDPLDATPHFADKPGKRLVQNTPIHLAIRSGRLSYFADWGTPP